MRCWRPGAGWPQSSAVWKTWMPLGALLADLREFDEADRIYQRALREYRDVSPFAVAWVCFQLGVLWGELVPRAPIRLGPRTGIARPSSICRAM